FRLGPRLSGGDGYFIKSAAMSPMAAIERTTIAATTNMLATEELSPPSAGLSKLGVGWGRGAGAAGLGAGAGAGLGFAFTGSGAGLAGTGAALGAGGEPGAIFPRYARLFCVSVVYFRQYADLCVIRAWRSGAAN